MKAFDTNVLVYAFDASSAFHAMAAALLREQVEGSAPWAIAWSCVYEFLKVVTHPTLTQVRLSTAEAWDNIRSVIESPSLILLTETERHVSILESLLRKTNVTGNLVHDAHIAALLIEHGVREIVTADEDFRRFEGLIVTNPFR